MEQFRKFLRDNAFALVLAACLLAAAAAGVWAVRTVRKELKKDLDAVRSPSSTAPGIDEGIRTSPGLAGEEEAEWQQQTAPAANSGKCAKSRQLVRWGCVLFWCAVWVWFGARTLRAANRVLACQQFGCACLHAACLGARLKQLQRR